MITDISKKVVQEYYATKRGRTAAMSGDEEALEWDRKRAQDTWFERIFGRPLELKFPKYSTRASYEQGLQRQIKLDTEFAGRLKWPKWLLYHYPHWSIGHGLMTTGERRRLINFYSYEIHTLRFWILVHIYRFFLSLSHVSLS